MITDLDGCDLNAASPLALDQLTNAAKPVPAFGALTAWLELAREPAQLELHQRLLRCCRPAQASRWRRGPSRAGRRRSGGIGMIGGRTCAEGRRCPRLSRRRALPKPRECRAVATLIGAVLHPRTPFLVGSPGHIVCAFASQPCSVPHELQIAYGGAQLIVRRSPRRIAHDCEVRLPICEVEHTE